MLTIPAENGFSEIVIRDNAHILIDPTEAEVIDAIQNNSEDVLIRGQAPLIRRSFSPRYNNVRTIASLDTRLIVEAEADKDGWEFSPGFWVDKLHLVGIGGIQKKPGSGISGVKVRVTARDLDRGVRDLLIEDCFFDGFDTGIRSVDDGARRWGNEQGSRINAKIRRCIIPVAIGTDSHAIGIYLEGQGENTTVEGCFIDKSGWSTDRNAPSLKPNDDPNEPEANKREHCIYGQSLNMKINLIDNFFGRPSANAYQLRKGGDSIGNVLWRCPVGGWHNDRPNQKIIRNVVIDQVDIVDTERFGNDKGRGHGIFISSSPNPEFIENIVARKHGWMTGQAGLDVGGGKTIRNHIYDWGPDTSKYFKSLNESRAEGNVVSEKAPDLPTVTDSMIEQWTNRPRGEWNDNTNHIAYRNKVQEVVFMRKD